MSFVRFNPSEKKVSVVLFNTQSSFGCVVLSRELRSCLPVCVVRFSLFVKPKHPTLGWPSHMCVHMCRRAPCTDTAKSAITSVYDESTARGKGRWWRWR